MTMISPHTLSWGLHSAIPYLPYGDTGRDTVEPYDLVTAELEAAVEGVETPFRGTYTFEVGYSNFLEGFDDALIGLRGGGAGHGAACLSGPL